MGSWSVAGVVRSRAESDAAALVMTSDEASLTAGELDARTSRVGRALVASGCRPGDRVGFIGRNQLAWYELLFGAAKAGVIAIGLGWRLSEDELIAIATDAELRVIFAGDEFDEAARQLTDRATGSPALVLSTEWAAWRDAHPSIDPGHVASADEDALQLYTSGTTGTPKGVLLPTRAVESSLVAARRWCLHEGANALVNLPLSHFGGTGWPIWALALGGRCTIHREVDAARTVSGFREDVTTCLAVPQILRSLCDEADRTGGGPFPALECIGYGSAPIREDLLLRTLRTFECGLVQTYGLTESCGVLTQLGPDEHDPAGPRRHLLRSAGRAVHGVEVRIEGDSPGDVLVRAPWLMSGYWRRPEATDAALTPGGWLRTGDVGFVDDEGYLYLTDRATDMIVTGGENVYPTEVESVLARHPGVADVAVVGVPDDRWGETVAAVVVPSGEPDGESLIEFARTRLAHFKCPTKVAFAASLPRNATGKVLRRELVELFLPGCAGR